MKSYINRIGLLFGFVVGVALPLAHGQEGRAAAVADGVARKGYTNRLARERSPYLLQHAHNPVDWYPWGEEAFAKARREEKPIFLSIGYSTCHWCHVMEHETFEDPTMAEVMNRDFVNIKVDREERPDVDEVYMTFVQATTGRGGWPMSVWLTPELEPFFGGTYFPPEGFREVLSQINRAWAEEREKILASSASAIRQLKSYVRGPETRKVALEAALLEKAYEQIRSSYDSKQGGFGSAPKFPRPVVFNFLFRYQERAGKKEALEMALFTLRKMAEGGMHDHLGGGFHRYSTDARWHVPHFEKMLYDQAQLAVAYLEAYQVTHEEFYAGVARDILAYVERELTGPSGEFYSAEDADSPKPDNPGEQAEGAYYVWESGEIEVALGEKDADPFGYYYGVKKEGNVESDPRGEFPRKNVLIVSRSIEEVSEKFKRTPAEVGALLDRARGKLFQVRAKRPRPHLDDKTLTAWNGLMISAFARGYQVLGDSSYLDTAEKAADFVRDRLYESRTGTLNRRYRGGEAAVDGYADDYAFLIQGLLDLYEASFRVKDLEWAVVLQQRQNELFADPDQGGYFSTTGKDASILLRVKNDYDGAEPSANSVSALNLIRLGEMTGREEFGSQVKKHLEAFGGRVESMPVAMPLLLGAINFHLMGGKQIVVAGRADGADTRAMLRVVRERFIPNKIVLLADGGEGQRFLGKELEFVREMKMLEGKATAYVCEGRVCKLPTTDLKVLRELLGGD